MDSSMLQNELWSYNGFFGLIFYFIFNILVTMVYNK